MLFFMLERFPNINKVIINDINPGLINCYRQIKRNHVSLIMTLIDIENKFYQCETEEERREYYNCLRDRYNSIPIKSRNTIRAAALFIFFNKTCFNGLYRENKQGDFNVPYGKYRNPRICNQDAIVLANFELRNVQIELGDYRKLRRMVDWSENNFFYFDPPYRPLLGSNNFKQYTKDAFGDRQQEELKEFCDEINDNCGHFLLSNSYSEIEPGVGYFDQLYEGYKIQHIYAPRTINAFVPGVQTVKEVLIKNY